MNKFNTHIVIKREDVLKYLTDAQRQALEDILQTIGYHRAEDNKKSYNDYYICNKDEPYAEMVHGVIVGGEYAKKQLNR